jgi:hypothetical protein
MSLPVIPTGQSDPDKPKPSPRCYLEPETLSTNSPVQPRRRAQNLLASLTGHCPLRRTSGCLPRRPQGAEPPERLSWGEVAREGEAARPLSGGWGLGSDAGSWWRLVGDDGSGAGREHVRGQATGAVRARVPSRAVRGRLTAARP